MKKAITLCALFAVAGCLMLLTGCEPNVNNDGAAGGTTPLETTPRTTTTLPEHDNNNDDLFDDDINRDNDRYDDINDTDPFNHHDNEPAVGDETPAAPSYEKDEMAPVIPASVTLPDLEIELDGLSVTKIGWGLGRDTDARNRPVDALTAQKKYAHLGAIFIDDETDNKIYLTFDEGYENGFTPPILDALKAAGVPATFFVTYDYAKDNPELIRRMIDEGHVIANHSFTHPSFPGLTDEQVRDEIIKLHEYIRENFNYEMNLIRFPMGEFSERVLAITANLGYRSVFWSFAYVDWQVDNQPPPADALLRITNAAHPGAVILLHAVSATNAAILPDVLEYWVNNGYELAVFD